MKKSILTLIALIFGLGLYAQTTEEVIITPDSLHLYFHGCSPHGERMCIINKTSDDFVIERCYSDDFHVECLYLGENFADDGYIIPTGDTLEFYVYAAPLHGSNKGQQDLYGKLLFETNLGIFSTTIFYQTVWEAQENIETISLYPNPANETLTLTGESLQSVCIYNILGQKVEECHSEGDEIKISTAHLPNGIYFVKTNQGVIQRFMIAH